MDSRFIGLVIEAGLGVGQTVAGQYDLLLDQQRLAAAFGVNLCAIGWVAGQCGFQRPWRVIHHANFKGGGTAQNVLRPGG